MSEVGKISSDLDAGGSSKLLTRAQARNRQQAIDEERNSSLRYKENERFASLKYGVVCFVCGFAALLVGMVGLTVYENYHNPDVLVAELKPYLNNLGFAIIGAIVGAVFDRS